MHYPDYFSDGYSFSRWWYQGVPVWGDQIKEMLPRESKRYFLEIGCYEGLSAIMTIENLLDDGDSISLIDPFTGVSDEGENLQTVCQTFLNNISNAKTLYPERDINISRMKSEQALHGYITKGCEFDFIFIDGSHKTSDVEKDLVLSWRILSKGGVMICDDYQWRGVTKESNPAMAIDNFIASTDGLSIIFEDQQIGIQKI